MNKAITAIIAALVFSVGSANATTLTSFDDDYLTPDNVTIHNRITQPKPLASDCYIISEIIDFSDHPKLHIVDDWNHLAQALTLPGVVKTKAEYFEKMDEFLTEPSLINCQHPKDGATILHKVANPYLTKYRKKTDQGPYFLWTTEWAISKGIDLSLTMNHHYHHHTARERAIYNKEKITNNSIWKPLTTAQYEEYINMLIPQQAEQFPLCSDVDGTRPPASDSQVPPPDVYCILFENVQESLEDTEQYSYVPNATRHYVDDRLSGLALFKGWKSIVSFRCNAPAGKTCDSRSFNFDDSWPEHIKGHVKTNYGTNVRCGFSSTKVPIFHVDSMESGQVKTSTHSTSIAYISPSYRICTAIPH